MKPSERRYRKVKFVQIAADGQGLYGLDKEGRVWRWSEMFESWGPMPVFGGDPTELDQRTYV